MNAPEPRAVATVEAQRSTPIDLLSPQGFEFGIRLARALASSNAVPEQFRATIEKKDRDFNVTYVENPNAIGNCLVAIEVARSIGMSVVSVMQNADNINGKLRWTSKFQIAAVNASGRFGPLQYDIKPRGKIKAKYREKQGWNKQTRKYDYVEHEVEIEDVECRAWAYARQNGVLTTRRVEGPPVSMKMAVEEGWYAKDGSKWQGEMRELMLQYRAGTFFAAIHASDIVMGMGQPAEVERDIIDITPETIEVQIGRAHV